MKGGEDKLTNTKINDKITICIDLDNTIINTPRTIINLHNRLYPNKRIEYVEDISWEFYPMIQTKEELNNLLQLFTHEDFYKEVVIFPNAIETIKEWCEGGHTIIICSKHINARKPLTTKWIQEVMPDVEIVFVDNFKDKSKVKCDIVIDDNIEALESFDNKVSKICHGDYQWNKDWQGIRQEAW